MSPNCSNTFFFFLPPAAQWELREMDKRERLQKITGNKSFSSARLSTELFNKMAAIILWIAESSWTASKNREGSRKQPSGSTGDLTAPWKWVSDCNFPNFPAWLGHETGLERLEWRGGEVWSDYCFSAVQSCRKSRDKRTLRAAPLVCVEARSSQRQQACYCTTSGDHKSAKSLKRGLFKSYKHQNPIAGRVWLRVRAQDSTWRHWETNREKFQFLMSVVDYSITFQTTRRSSDAVCLRQVWSSGCGRLWKSPAVGESLGCRTREIIYWFSSCWSVRHEADAWDCRAAERSFIVTVYDLLV